MWFTLSFHRLLKKILVIGVAVASKNWPKSLSGAPCLSLILSDI